MENFLVGLSVGSAVWLFAYGLNRIYLKFKDLVS